MQLDSLDLTAAVHTLQSQAQAAKQHLEAADKPEESSRLKHKSSLEMIVRYRYPVIIV